MKPRDYDSTVARIAGNIAAGIAAWGIQDKAEIAAECVALARLIVAETKHTEPTQERE